MLIYRNQDQKKNLLTAASTSQGPKEIGILIFVRSNETAVRRDYFSTQDLVSVSMLA